MQIPIHIHLLKQSFINHSSIINDDDTDDGGCGILIKWGGTWPSGQKGCISKVTGSNPSGGSEFTFRSDLLLTVRSGSM
jgi:hypothetical protein